MTTYAALTDGTTTITFASPGTLGWYRIETGWTPKVAQLRRNQLGGRGPYEDVTEEIPVSIGGSNAAHLYANYQALEGLIDQANRWYRGDNASAVLFKYSPEGATVSTAASPLQSVTWNADINLPGGFSNIPQSGSAVWTQGGTMRFTRRGLWIHTSASGSASGVNGASSPVIVAVASSAYPAPTDLSITNIITGKYVYSQIPTGYIVIAEDASTVQFFNMEAAGSNPLWTVLSGAGASATGDPVGGSPLGGSLISYLFNIGDPQATYSPSQYISLTGRRYFAMANVKTRLQTDTVSFRAYINPVSTAPTVGITLGAVYSPLVSYRNSDSTDTKATAWIPIGGIQAPAGGSLYFGLQVPLGATVPASPVYFDSAVLIDTTRPYCIIPFYSNSANNLASASSNTVTLTSNALTFISPSSSYGGSSLTVDGDGYISTRSGSLYCYVLASGVIEGSGGSPSTLESYGWQQGYVTSLSYTSKLTNTITATRWTSYNSPV